jgi:hypothetical protein
MSDPNQAPKSTELFWTPELRRHASQHTVRTRRTSGTSFISSLSSNGFNTPNVPYVPCVDDHPSFTASASSNTSTDASSARSKSKVTKLIKIHTELEDEADPGVESLPSSGQFRLIADEIIHCDNPNEERPIDRSEYAPLSGRQFVTASSILIGLCYLIFILGFAYLFTLIEQVSEDSLSLFRLQSEFARVYPDVDGKSCSTCPL